MNSRSRISDSVSTTSVKPGKATAAALLLAFICQLATGPLNGQDIAEVSRLSPGTLSRDSGSYPSYGTWDSGVLALSGWTEVTASSESGQQPSDGDASARDDRTAHPSDATVDGPDPDKWTFELAPYMWMAGLTGNATIDGARVSGTMSFSDILDDLDLSVMAHMEARKGDFGVFVDTLFIELSDDFSVFGPIDLDVRLQLLLVEVAGFYRFAELSVDKLIEGSTIVFEGLAGNRLVYIDSRANFDPGPSADDDKTWLDPMIGVRARWSFTKKLWLAARGDIGGFGIGSHFAWNVQGLLGYQFTPGIFAAAGYRVLDINYSDGHGNQKWAFDARLYGPVIGFGIRF